MSNRLARLAWIAPTALAGTLLVTAPAQAAGVDPATATAAQKAEAMTHFNAGKKAVDAQNWEKATLELRASLDLVDSPNARLVLARALRDAGQLTDAWTEYGRTIDDAVKLDDAGGHYGPAMGSAQIERADLEAKLAFVVISYDKAPPEATLKVAGRVIPAAAWAMPIVVPAGAVDVVVTDPSGKEVARKTVAAAVGEKTPVDLDAPPPAPPPPPAAATTPSPDDVPPTDRPDQPPPPPPPTPPSGRSTLRTYSYVAGGVGVAGFVVFGVFGAMEKSTYSGLQGACPGNVCPPSKSGDISNGKTQELVANIGLGVGIAGIAAGATLFALSFGGGKPATPSRSASTSLVISAGYIGLRGDL
jgi:hypothetical protein